jgi:hypothetical protein
MNNSLAELQKTVWAAAHPEIWRLGLSRQWAPDPAATRSSDHRLFDRNPHPPPPPIPSIPHSINGFIFLPNLPPTVAAVEQGERSGEQEKLGESLSPSSILISPAPLLLFVLLPLLGCRDPSQGSSIWSVLRFQAYGSWPSLIQWRITPILRLAEVVEVPGTGFNHGVGAPRGPWQPASLARGFYRYHLPAFSCDCRFAVSIIPSAHFPC